MGKPCHCVDLGIRAKAADRQDLHKAQILSTDEAATAVLQQAQSAALTELARNRP